MRICRNNLCQMSLEGEVGQRKYCSRACYRRDPVVKVRYSHATSKYLHVHNREIGQRYKKLGYKCKHKNIEFNLSLEQYELLVCGASCHYCGVDLIVQTGVALDRVDSGGGYTIDNVVPCCGPCNQIKNVHLTFEEMRVAMNAVLIYRQGRSK